MVSQINPLVLAFDLDETLFSAQLWEEKPPKPLSNSAGLTLSNSTEGLLKKQPARTFPDGTFIAHKVTAINRQEMNSIFKKIYEVMQRCKEQNFACPIAVKIITTGTYGEEEIKNIFDKFYGEGTNRFSSGDFPIQFFNSDNLNKKLKPMRLDNPFLTANGYISLQKAELMDAQFPNWKNQFVGNHMKELVKSRVFLIDNADGHTEAVKMKGFSAIHYPTTEHERAFKTFTIEGPNAITTLNKLVSELLAPASAY